MKFKIKDLIPFLEKELEQNQYKKWNIEYVTGFRWCLQLVKNYLKHE